MTVAAVTNVGAANLDATVSSLAIPFVASINQCLVAHIAIRTKTVSVSNVTDSFGNTWTKQAAITAIHETDYAQGRFNKNPIYDSGVDGECWTTRSGGAVTTVTVTLTSGAKFAVDLQSYTGSGFGATATATAISTSAPSISLATQAGNSWVSAGFACTQFYNQTASGVTGAGITGAGGVYFGILRGTETVGVEGSVQSSGVVSVTCADNALVGGTGATCGVTLAETDLETVDGVTFPFPGTYAICAVEVKS